MSGSGQGSRGQPALGCGRSEGPSGSGKAIGGIHRGEAFSSAGGRQKGPLKAGRYYEQAVHAALGHGFFLGQAILRHLYARPQLAQAVYEACHQLRAVLVYKTPFQLGAH